jgi:hypothetical protein
MNKEFALLLWRAGSWENRLTSRPLGRRVLRYRYGIIPRIRLFILVLFFYHLLLFWLLHQARWYRYAQHARPAHGSAQTPHATWDRCRLYQPYFQLSGRRIGNRYCRRRRKITLRIRYPVNKLVFLHEQLESAAECAPLRVARRDG